MGLQIQAIYDGNCLTNYNTAFTENGLVPSCVSGVYVQYLDQAFVINLKKGGDQSLDTISQNYVGPLAGNLLTQVSDSNNVRTQSF